MHRLIAIITLTLIAWHALTARAMDSEPASPAPATQAPRSAAGSVTNATSAATDLAAGRKAIGTKDWQTAIRHLHLAEKREPNNADAQNLLGYSYRNAGQWKVALKHYDRALSLNPDHRGAREYLGELYLQRKDLAKAEEQQAALERICRGACEELTELREKIRAYRQSQKRSDVPPVGFRLAGIAG